MLILSRAVLLTTLFVFCTLGVFSWADDCPDESHLTGSSPPEGYSRGCVITQDNGEQIKHGHWKDWYMNGQPSAEGDYFHGKQHGVWTWWFPNGQKRQQGKYWDGSPVGTWHYWNQDGRALDSKGKEINSPKSRNKTEPSSSLQNMPDFSDFSKSLHKNLNK